MTLAGGGLVIVLVALWAFSPLDDERPALSLACHSRGPLVSPAAAESQKNEDETFDVSVFDVALWPARRGAGIRGDELGPAGSIGDAFSLELIATTREGGVLRAAIYDATRDRIVVAGEGDRIAGYVVGRVGAASVRLVADEGEQVLSMKRADR